MKTTPVFQFPYVEAGDRARDFPATTESMVKAIEAALLDNGQPPVGSDLRSLLTRVAALEAGGANDTGWQPLAAASSSFVADPNEPPQVRKIGHVVLSRGQFNPASGNLVAGTMTTYPVAFRPTVRSIWSQNTAANGFARVIMSLNGQLATGTPTVTSSYIRLDGMTWTDN